MERRLLRNMKKIIITLLFCCFFCQFLFAESFRVHKTLTEELTEQTTAINVELGINDVLYLTLPEDSLFLQGLELDVKISQVAAYYKDAIAYSLYEDIQPIPDETTIDYSGTRLHIDTFPGRLSYHIQIPLKDDHSMQMNPYTTMLPVALKKPVKDIFFRIQLVMKGSSQELLDAVFGVEIKPIFTNEGLFDLSILYPPELENEQSENSFIVFIDEEPIEFTGEPLILETGIHHLSISSEDFRNEVRTFTIDQIQTTFLEVQLKDIAPLLVVSAPENALFFINNIEYPDFSKPIIIEPGDHQLRFSMGDYEVVRTLEVVNGRTYNISVTFDVKITEE